MKNKWLFADEATKARRVAQREWLNDLKSSPCTDCGGTFPPCAMDFDHVRGEKRFNVAEMLGRSWKALKAEVAKCDIVCANCHRIRTFHQETY